HKNIVAFGNVDSRISIERSARRHAAYTRRRIAPLHREIESAAQILAYFYQLVLWSLQGGSYGVLLGMIGAQAGPQQTLNALIVLLHRHSIAAHDSPADAPAGSKIIFGKSAKGDDRNIRRDRCHRDMLVVIENELVVNFVGKNEQVMLPGQFSDLLQHSPGAHRACG